MASDDNSFTPVASRATMQAMFFGSCIVLVMLLGMSLFDYTLRMPTPTPTIPPPEAQENMTQFAHFDQSNCPVTAGCAHGWGEPVVSPNGKFQYINNSRHYGWVWVAVLTSDYTEEVFYSNWNDMGSMSPGGCAATGWTDDNDVLIECIASHRTGLIDSKTWQVIWDD